MGFWGMSSEGKNARNAISGIANQVQNNGQYWNDRGKDQANKGDEATGWAYDYWKNANQQGVATPGQNRSVGYQIMDLQPYTENTWKNLANIQSNWENTVPKAAQTMDTVNQNWDSQGNAIRSTGDFNQGIIDSAYGGMTGRANDVNAGNVNQINQTYGQAQGDWNKAYDAMGNRVGSAYGDLLKQSGNAYDQMAQNVEKLRPGSEFQIAQTARQFAPAMAAAAGRLRRSGIDPNGVQASSVLGGVEANRARAMDDAAAAGTNNYVNAANSVLGGRLNTNIGLTSDMVGQQNQLGSAQAAGNQGLTLGQGNALTTQANRNQDVQNAIDQQRAGLNLENSNLGFDRTNNWYNQGSQNALMNKALAEDDFNTYKGLIDQQNQQSLNDLNLNLQQYQLGQQQNAADLAQKNLAAQQIGNIGQQQTGNALGMGQLGAADLNSAANLYNQIYGREAANAGWGAKLLGGIGGSLLGGLTGGLSTGLGNWGKGLFGG